MPTYTATIQLSNGTLSVVRPHPSDTAADDLFDNAIYAVRDSESPVTSVGITVVTEGSTPATPPLPDTLDADPDGTVSGPLPS